MQSKTNSETARDLFKGYVELGHAWQELSRMGIEIQPISNALRVIQAAVLDLLGVPTDDHADRTPEGGQFSRDGLNMFMINTKEFDDLVKEVERWKGEGVF